MSPSRVRFSLSLVIFISFILGAAFCFLNGEAKVDMNYKQYNNIFLFYLFSLLGILSCLGISKIMTFNKFIGFVGKNTIIVLGLSGIPFFVISGIYYLLYKKLIFDISIGMGILISCLQIIMLTPLMLVINKYLPFILGRNKCL